MPPRVKEKNTEVALEAANFDDMGDPEDLPFDLDLNLEDLDIESLGNIDAEITSADLLAASEELGKSVILEVEEEPSLIEASLQLLTKEVRDSQVMVVKMTHELETFQEAFLATLGACQKALLDRMDGLETIVRSLQSTPPAEPEGEKKESLSESQKLQALNWIKRQPTLPGRDKVAELLSKPFGVSQQTLLDFFKESGLNGRGNALKRPE